MGKAVRLDKFLADAKLGTRSEVKKWIQKGRVQVNGITAKKSDEKVLETDEVIFDGEPVGAVPEFVYYLLHKPAGYVSATEDSRDRTVLELLPEEFRRKGLFPAGRLDKDTEGLILITNDGALAHKLLSPKKHVDKTYYAQAEGEVTEEDVRKFAEGIDIGEKNLTLPAKLEILSVKEGRSEILITVCEGKFHQVKRMVKAVGKEVTYLKRMSMGPLILPEELEKGRCRPLTEEELAALNVGFELTEAERRHEIYEAGSPLALDNGEFTSKM